VRLFYLANYKNFAISVNTRFTSNYISGIIKLRLAESNFKKMATQKPNAVHLQAMYVGKKIDIKGFLDKYKYYISSKEPYILAYPNNKYIVLYRYGTMVFWGLELEEINHFIGQITPFIIDPLKNPTSETMLVHVDIKQKGEKVKARGGEVQISKLDNEEIGTISEVIARSAILDNYERQVEEMLSEFGEVIESFSRLGKTSSSTKSLLKKVGMAMKIQHSAVSQMAILDKPDLTWEDAELSELYSSLDKEYELKERYDLLNDKLRILFHDVEFIVNYIDSRKSMQLEVIIVVLILIEVFFTLSGLASH
jgi:uncharacterized Rmd1/YagE family protein